MNKLCVVFVIGIFVNNGLGQLDDFSKIFGPIPGQDTRPGLRPETVQSTEAAPTTQSPVVRNCIRTCPVTTEYNPVCGTNGVTYNNPGRLRCAQICGINVSQFSTSRCPPAQ